MQLVGPRDPPFIMEDESEEIRRNKMCAFFVLLTLDVVTERIIADCIGITKLNDMLSSLGVSNLTNKVYA